jgi:hypothetical protein
MVEMAIEHTHIHNRQRRIGEEKKSKHIVHWITNDANEQS